MDKFRRALEEAREMEQQMVDELGREVDLLERWPVCLSGLGDDDAKEIAEALTNNEDVRALILRHNMIGDTGAEAIGRALENNETLQKLDLGNNKIGDAGAEAIGRALEENHTLEELDLHRNKMGDAGAEAIGRMLEKNLTLRKLNLDEPHAGWNAIGDAGLEALAAGLEEIEVNRNDDLCQAKETYLAFAQSKGSLNAAEVRRVLSETLALVFMSPHRMQQLLYRIRRLLAQGHGLTNVAERNFSFSHLSFGTSSIGSGPVYRKMDAGDHLAPIDLSMRKALRSFLSATHGDDDAAWLSYYARVGTGADCFEVCLRGRVKPDKVKVSVPHWWTRGTCAELAEERQLEMAGRPERGAALLRAAFMHSVQGKRKRKPRAVLAAVGDTRAGKTTITHALLHDKVRKHESTREAEFHEPKRLSTGLFSKAEFELQAVDCPGEPRFLYYNLPFLLSDASNAILAVVVHLSKIADDDALKAHVDGWLELLDKQLERILPHGESLCVAVVGTHADVSDAAKRRGECLKKTYGAKTKEEKKKEPQEEEKEEQKQKPRWSRIASTAAFVLALAEDKDLKSAAFKAFRTHVIEQGKATVKRFDDAAKEAPGQQNRNEVPVAVLNVEELLQTETPAGLEPFMRESDLVTALLERVEALRGLPRTNVEATVEWLVYRRSLVRVPLPAADDDEKKEEDGNEAEAIIATDPEMLAGDDDEKKEEDGNDADAIFATDPELLAGAVAVLLRKPDGGEQRLFLNVSDDNAQCSAAEVRRCLAANDFAQPCVSGNDNALFMEVLVRMGVLGRSLRKDSSVEQQYVCAHRTPETLSDAIKREKVGNKGARTLGRRLVLSHSVPLGLFFKFANALTAAHKTVYVAQREIAFASGSTWVTVALSSASGEEVTVFAQGPEADTAQADACARLLRELSAIVGVRVRHVFALCTQCVRTALNEEPYKFRTGSRSGNGCAPASAAALVGHVCGPNVHTLHDVSVTPWHDVDWVWEDEVDPSKVDPKPFVFLPAAELKERGMQGIDMSAVEGAWLPCKEQKQPLATAFVAWLNDGSKADQTAAAAADAWWALRKENESCAFIALHKSSRRLFAITEGWAQHAILQDALDVAPSFEETVLARLASLQENQGAILAAVQEGFSDVMEKLNAIDRAGSKDDEKKEEDEAAAQLGVVGQDPRVLNFFKATRRRLRAVHAALDAARTGLVQVNAAKIAKLQNATEDSAFATAKKAVKGAVRMIAQVGVSKVPLVGGAVNRGIDSLCDNAFGGIGDNAARHVLTVFEHMSSKGVNGNDMASVALTLTLDLTPLLLAFPHGDKRAKELAEHVVQRVTMCLVRRAFAGEQWWADVLADKDGCLEALRASASCRALEWLDRGESFVPKWPDNEPSPEWTCVGALECAAVLVPQKGVFVPAEAKSKYGARLGSERVVAALESGLFGVLRRQTRDGAGRYTELGAFLREIKQEHVRAHFETHLKKN